MICGRSQRWRDRRAAFVPGGSVIDPRDYAVDAVDSWRIAKPFVERHHYSGSYPATRLAVGLFRTEGLRQVLCGVAAFSVPVNDRCVARTAGLGDPLSAVDLGRFVCDPEVAGNGESFFLSRAFRTLRREKPGVLAVMSYADPVEVRDASGAVTKRGHVGAVYQVLGAHYRGRTGARLHDVLPDGRTFSARAAAKLRSGGKGHAYAVDQLVAAGAPRPEGDDLAAWLRGLRASGFMGRRRHPGAHAYCWSLTRAARHAAAGLPRLAYPVVSAEPTGDDVTAPPLLAGSARAA